MTRAGGGHIPKDQDDRNPACRVPLAQGISRGLVIRIPSLFIAATILVCATGPAIGLTDDEIYGALRFPFAAPGGRMAGMGGAGLALIDDAGACRFNPARLSAISRPTAQLETRYQQFEAGSGGSGLVLYDAGVYPFAGTEIDADSSYDSGLGLSYLAIVWPVPLKRPLVIAASQSQTLNTVIEIDSVTRTTPPSAPVTSMRPRSPARSSRPLFMNCWLRKRWPPWQWKQSAPRSPRAGSCSVTNNCNPRCSCGVRVTSLRAARSNLDSCEIRVRRNCSKDLAMRSAVMPALPNAF